MIDNLISNIRSLINTDPGEVETIISLFRPREYRKGEFILSEGQVCRYAGFISKGLIRYYINHEGEEKTYEFGQENSFVCNYESFLPQLPSTKIIQALEDCEIQQISFDDVQVLYRSVREGERFGRLVIEQVFVQLIKALASLYTDTPEQRYMKLAGERPELLQRVSQYHIASYVGIKPQSLSRIRRRIFIQK